VKLDIGIRRPGTEGWTTVDIFPGADLVTPMWYLQTVEGPVTEIRATHCLEHVAFERVQPTLAEWHRVLVPGGFVVIEVPDLEWCVREWLEGRRGVDVIFGTQEDEGQFHRTGFTRQSLRDALLWAGFQAPTIEYIDSHDRQSIWARAMR
jgi:predicted SAM-dependent methyltransferase